MSNPKPNRPEGCPLRPHARGKWTGRINGKQVYVGNWKTGKGDGLAEALKEFEAKKLEIGGIEPDEHPIDQLTLKDVATKYLDQAKAEVESGSRSKGHLEAQIRTVTRFVKFIGPLMPAFDLRADNFNAYKAYCQQIETHGKKWTLKTLSGDIGRVRSFIVWVYQMYNEGTNPKFGPSFKTMTAKEKRMYKAGKESKLLEPKTILTMLHLSNDQEKAMILLGLNCGFGHVENESLELNRVLEALDPNHANHQWLVGYRVKTGIRQEAWLWPETMEALQRCLDNRPDSDSPEFFINHATGRGFGAEKHATKGHILPNRFVGLRERMGRPELKFGDLRHTMQSIGYDTGDAHAVNLMAGHRLPEIEENYMQKRSKTRLFKDERMIRVSQTIRQWLFTADQEPATIRIAK